MALYTFANGQFLRRDMVGEMALTPDAIVALRDSHRRLSRLCPTSALLADEIDGAISKAETYRANCDRQFSTNGRGL